MAQKQGGGGKGGTDLTAKTPGAETQRVKRVLRLRRVDWTGE